MMADTLLNMIGNEKKSFDEWAKSQNLETTEIQDLEDFLTVLETENYTNNDLLNQKIAKSLD